MSIPRRQGRRKAAIRANPGGELLPSGMPQGLAVDVCCGSINTPQDVHQSEHANLEGGSSMSIAVGQPAPDFTLKDQDQKDVRLGDLRGKNVVIVFYPLDWSPVCTNEHACFVNDMKKFESLNAQILGLSVDSVWSHKAYAEKMGIQYRLLADFQPRGSVAEKFGVYLADKGITARAIAVVDKTGNIAWFKQYEILQVPDVTEVAEAIARLG
jgi:peroxiredoxin